MIRAAAGKRDDVIDDISRPTAREACQFSETLANRHVAFDSSSFVARGLVGVRAPDRVPAGRRMIRGLRVERTPARGPQDPCRKERGGKFPGHTSFIGNFVLSLGEKIVLCLRRRNRTRRTYNIYWRDAL